MKVPKDSIEVREVPVDLVLSDPAVTARFEQSEETIFRYSLSLARGEKFPPIDVFDLGMNYLLADGGHRLEAYRLEGIDRIWARVHPGGRREALIFAAGSNVKHGLLRTNRDKLRIVENVLKDPDLGRWSNNKIAEICAVSQPFVGKVRWQLTCNGYKFNPVRVSSTGREIDTSNIGQKKQAVDSEREVKVEETTEGARQNAEIAPTQVEATKNPGGDPELSVAPEVENPGTETAQADVQEPAAEIQSNSSAISAPQAEETAEVSAPIAEPESDDESEEDEAGVIVSYDVGTIAGSEPQEPEAITPPTDDDISILMAKIAELEETLKAKDLELQEKEKIIVELEAKIWALEQDIEYYMQEMKAFEKEELAREPAFKSKPAFTEAMV